MSVDSGENHELNDRYKLYVENCLKKDIRPYGPKDWAKRETKKHKEKLEQKKIVEDVELIQSTKIQFIIMMRQNGIASTSDVHDRARHVMELRRDETKTWNNDNPKPCPLCKGILCAWAL